MAAVVDLAFPVAVVEAAAEVQADSAQGEVVAAAVVALVLPAVVVVVAEAASAASRVVEEVVVAEGEETECTPNDGS